MTSGCVVLVQHGLVHAGKSEHFFGVTGVLQKLLPSPVPHQLFMDFSFAFDALLNSRFLSVVLQRYFSALAPDIFGAL